MAPKRKAQPKSGVEISVEQAKRLGFSPARATASGAGTHGGSKKQQRRRRRRNEDEAIRASEEGR